MSFFLHRLVKTDSKDAMHSSVYGKAQNEGAFGASSVTGFHERVQADQNRQTIRNYRDAQLVNEVGRKEILENRMRKINGGDSQAGSEGSGGSGDSGGSGRSGDFGFDRFGTEGTNTGGSGARKTGADASVRNTTAGMRGASRGVSSTPSRGSLGASSRPAPSQPPARRNPGIFR